jgi:DEAD/DEAH box helicase domain-containing protein
VPDLQIRRLLGLTDGSFLQQLRGQPWYQGQIVHVELIEAKTAQYGAVDHLIPASLLRQLSNRQILPIYRHQADAISELNDGKNVVLATSGASGKNLCYQTPAVASVIQHQRNRSLFLYPTKALAQDQLRSLEGIIPPELDFQSAIYDGDTPPKMRGTARQGVHALLTNPDMLHLGILPNHRLWASLFRSLRYVLIDEAHVYSGVFGSHMAEIIRRLRRIAARYGASPQFILCSATIANPEELASVLVGLPFRAITLDAAPSGAKKFAFGIRRS